MPTSAKFMPIDAVIGGLFIGAGSGLYMLLAKRVAGNSGALKELVVTKAGNEARDTTKLSYLLGLVIAGLIMKGALPDAFEEPQPAEVGDFLWGAVTGAGAFLANGCTSGHGLCGLSRLSLRSLVAVPVFMAAAIASSTISSLADASADNRTEISAPAPAAPMESRTSLVALGAAVALTLSLGLAIFHKRATNTEHGVGVLCGLCAGVGLTIGRMVRPSVVQAALSPLRIDFTLWTLFFVALATTFSFYRLARSCAGLQEACARGAARGRVDAQLVVGSILFGAGWGAKGFCPGPLIVAVAATPHALRPLLCLLGMIGGMQVAASWPRLREALRARGCAKVSAAKEVTFAKTEKGPPSPPASPPASEAAGDGKGPAAAAATAEFDFPTAQELRDALDAGAVVVDLRRPVGAETTEGALRLIDGAVCVPWDRGAKEMAVGALPVDKAAPIVVYCKSGNRANAAKAFLERQYSRVLNGGGPEGPSELWQTLCEARGELRCPVVGVEQLFDPGSSTLTYLLTDAETREAIIIDPVLEQVDRDLKEVEARGCRLVLALNTHCHADHVTGTGALKQRVPGLVSCISARSGAKADCLLQDGQAVEWAGGRRSLTAIATPGHTDGCVSYHDATMGCAFTGDTLLIGGCGRTDFQQGDAATLHESVHRRLFSLPPSTVVYPAHDYKGRRCSTIGAEKRSNPRLTKSKEEFIELMANLDLPYPKQIDVALPANLMCGI